MSRKLNTQPKLHVKKGDTVSVLSGNDKGKTGKILRVFPKKERVLVEGINIRVKHQKANQEFPQGGRISREMPIHVSNVLPLDPSTNQPYQYQLQPNGTDYKVCAQLESTKTQKCVTSQF